MRKLQRGLMGGLLALALSPALVSAQPPFETGFTVDCYHDGTFVTSFRVTFGPTFGPFWNAGTAFHIVGSTGILTSNDYTVGGFEFPPRGLPAVDARGDSVVCTGTYGGLMRVITGWITPRG